MEVQSQFIEMFGDLTQDTPWSKVVTITNGKAYPEEYQDKGLYPICGSGGIMYYGEKKLCNGNTTILGRKGNINSPIFMESDYWIVDTAFSLDVDKEKLHPKFFYYWCCQYDFTKLNKQGVLPSLTRKDLEKVEMAIPPMGMQKQFVSIAKQADKSKFVGFKSQFIEMFGTLDEPKVEIKKLIDVVLGSGQYGSNTSATDYQESMPRYIRITDINDDGSLNDDIKTAEVIDDKFRLVSGDIVFARTGATVGKTYLHEAGDAIYAGYLIKYQMDTNLMKPSFMKAFTHSKTYYDWVANSQKVGAQPNISATQYDQMPILVPSVCDQEAFLKIYQQADKSKFELRKSIEAIDRVIKSLINNV